MGIFDFFSEKLRKHPVDVNATDGHEKLLMERLEKVESALNGLKASAVASADKQTCRYEERQQGMLRPIHDMADFVMENFEFRHNVVRDLYEYRRKGTDGAWALIDKRQLNSINCRIQDDGQIFCLSSFVRQRIESDLAVDYHPVRTYLDKVRGQWDGKTDYIGDFAQRISGSDFCQRMVRIWLLDIHQRAMVLHP